jgi:hypothetical protein
MPPATFNRVFMFHSALQAENAPAEVEAPFDSI